MATYSAGGTTTFFRRCKLVIMPVVFIAPAFVMFALCVIYTIVQSVSLSFTEWQE